MIIKFLSYWTFNSRSSLSFSTFYMWVPYKRFFIKKIVQGSHLGLRKIHPLTIQGSFGSSQCIKGFPGGNLHEFKMVALTGKRYIKEIHHTCRKKMHFLDGCTCKRAACKRDSGQRGLITTDHRA